MAVVRAILQTVVIAFACLELTKERAESRLRAIAATDPLTSVANRRSLLGDAHDLIAAAPHDAAVLLFDLDHFKSVNDRYGHDVGDAVLLAFCCVARELLPSGALFGRLGGEEFAAFLIELEPGEAVAAAQAIRRAFARISPEVIPGLHLTVSAGVAAAAPGERDPGALRAGRRGALSGQGARPQPRRRRVRPGARGTRGRGPRVLHQTAPFAPSDIRNVCLETHMSDVVAAASRDPSAFTSFGTGLLALVGWGAFAVAAWSSNSAQARLREEVTGLRQETARLQAGREQSAAERDDANGRPRRRPGPARRRTAGGGGAASAARSRQGVGDRKRPCPAESAPAPRPSAPARKKRR